MIQNPVLKGFCPDPSIIRVEDDYYIATSTFEWWPGVKLFHSKDLKHWEQIPSPLRRMSQLNMLGVPTSGGVWAPCLSYDGRYFYLLFTDVKTKKGRFYNTHNYVVYTDDIYGEWSEPIYLNSIGFDPSLFHDTDGKKYLVNMVNGFKGILVQEIEPQSFRLLGERRMVYEGSGIGCTEGPHIYHVGDWYYLLVAEGGTGYDHCVTMARAKTVWGPYETAPNNPILTSNRTDMDALQKCGHGDLVETQNGEWFLAHLCSRPISGKPWCTLGRETALQKMEWDEDGWLHLKAGGVYAALETQEPRGIDEYPLCDEEEGFYDDFDEEKLHVRYASPRVPYDMFADCKSKRGHLRLLGMESMNSLHRVALIAVRMQTVECTAQTAMEFIPTCEQQMAGLAYMYDAMNFYLLGKTCAAEGNCVVVLLKSDRGEITDLVTSIEVSCDKRIEFKAEVIEEGTAVRFYFRESDGDWVQVGDAYSTKILTDEYCRGFTGAHMGLYCHDMAGLGGYADFDYMKVEK